MQNQGSQLAFVIVNWNGGELLRRAIGSITANPPSVSYEIVVVDNASSDESLSWLRSTELAQQLHPVKLTLIENSSNVGFGQANNQGFEATDAPLLFLLNSDAELRPLACDRMIATIESDQRIGACGPKLINPDGSLQISVWRNPPTAWATLISGLRLYKLLPKRLRGELLLAEFWDHNRRRDVSMLSGAAILARRKMIDDVGGFDARFHMYGEDNEWCLRILRAGWRIVFEPEATVMHHGGQSSQRRWTELEKLKVQTSAMFRFQHHCLSRRQLISNLMANITLLTVQRTLRRLGKRPCADIELNLSLHVEALKKALRNREYADTL